jgi:hypothetical protein
MTVLFFFIFYTTGLQSQSGLNGTWEGEITRAGMGAGSTYKFQLKLQVEGKFIKGESFIYISQDSIVRQELSGRMYEDRSIYLKEVHPGNESVELNEEGDEIKALHEVFTRKYQFVYDRSIWESSLQGHWQEVVPSSDREYKRTYGKIILKKKKPSKA